MHGCRGGGLVHSRQRTPQVPKLRGGASLRQSAGSNKTSVAGQNEDYGEHAASVSERQAALEGDRPCRLQ